VHEWRLGDIVMWNNTGTMHRVQPYDLTCGRRLHRTTVLGDEPFDPYLESAQARIPCGMGSPEVGAIRWAGRATR
jgi:Taurine catabolism dioxygenase TauD, TfdA family